MNPQITPIDAEMAAARTLWVPAVNNHGAFDRWAFIEIDDPWKAKDLLRSPLETPRG